MSGLGRALWAKKTKIIGFTLLVTVLAIVVVNVITPRYRSETRILLEAKENVFLRAEADKVADRTVVDPESVTSQTQVLLSRDLAREVIRKEGLKENPEFNSSGGILKTLLGLVGLGRDPSDMSAEERTLDAFYARLNVFAVDKSRVISVSFSSADPDLAANVANTIAATYLTLQQTAKQQQTRDASQWLAGEIAKLRQKVSEAESNVERYRTQSNLYGGANNTSLPTQQLTEINSQIATVRGQKADLETRARQLREMLRSGRSVDASDVANSETIRRLTEQRVTLRSQIAEQSTTLLDQHPRMRELNAQAGELDRQIRAEGERLVRQLENDAKVSGDRLTQLTASLDQVKKLASATNEQDVQLRAIEREAKAQRELLESYLAKYREAIARDNINAAPAEARIISRASPAIVPDYPKKMPIVLIAAFAAFTLVGRVCRDRRVAGALRQLRLFRAAGGLCRFAAHGPSDGAGDADDASNAAWPCDGRAAANCRWRRRWPACRLVRWSKSRPRCDRPVMPAGALWWPEAPAMSAQLTPQSHWHARWRKAAMSS